MLPVLNHGEFDIYVMVFKFLASS